MEKGNKFKDISTELDSLLGKVWRTRCAEETGVSYRTVINVIDGDSQNKKVKDWLIDELQTAKMRFI